MRLEIPSLSSATTFSYNARQPVEEGDLHLHQHSYLFIEDIYYLHSRVIFLSSVLIEIKHCRSSYKWQHEILCIFQYYIAALASC